MIGAIGYQILSMRVWRRGCGLGICVFISKNDKSFWSIGIFSFFNLIESFVHTFDFRMKFGELRVASIRCLIASR